MACKCGSRRRVGTLPFVIILAKDLNRNIKRTLTGLGDSPIFLETSEQFCAVPARRWYQFNLFGFNPFNSIIDQKWAERCECIPEKGRWTVQLTYRAQRFGSDGRLVANFSGSPIYQASKPPIAPLAVSVPLSSTTVSWRLLIQPLSPEAPYFLATFIDVTASDTIVTVQSIVVKFIPNGCFVGAPPFPPLGRYPAEPVPRSPIPPPIFSYPDEPEPLPKPKPPTRIPKVPPIPRPLDECCDCC